MWKVCKHEMKWSEGDIWTSKTPLITQSAFFCYKYAVFEDKFTKLIGWERGIDRIADLEIMPDLRIVGKDLDAHQNNMEGLYNYETSCNPDSNSSLFQNIGSLSSAARQKQVQYNDDWEQYQVGFTVWNSEY